MTTVGNRSRREIRYVCYEPLSAAEVSTIQLLILWRLCWCREGESNPQGTKYRRILSPLRLPVPPSRLRWKCLIFQSS